MPNYSDAQAGCDYWKARAKKAEAELARAEESGEKLLDELARAQAERDEALNEWQQADRTIIAMGAEQDRKDKLARLWAEQADKIQAELDEYRGKLESGYSFCHPCDDCEAQVGWSRAAGELILAVKALRRLRDAVNACPTPHEKWENTNLNMALSEANATLAAIEGSEGEQELVEGYRAMADEDRDLAEADMAAGAETLPREVGDG